MNTYTNKKILVIGSFKHQLADKCIGWSEIKSPYLATPYLGDYHLLIINLQSLYESEIDEEIQKTFERIRQEINEIIWANTEVICITAPTVNKGGFIVNHNGVHFPSISNYHWCPIYLNFIKKEGESFEKKPESGYFQYVKKWTHFLEYSPDESLTLYKLQYRTRVFPKFNYLLKNLAKKPLAFELRFMEFDASKDPFTGKIHVRNDIVSNAILFLPPPTTISVEDAINYLLKQERGVIEVKGSELPKWTENILLHGEESIRKKIKENEELKKKLEKELEKENLKLSELIKFKRLLTADGEELENIVEDTFKLMGIEIKLGPKGKEDRVIIDPATNSEIPVEITGVKYSIPESKLNQLIGRLTDEERIKKIRCKCKGVLIGNHYKEEPLNLNLQGRKNPFEPDVVKKAEISKVCLLSTLELFKAVNAKLAGENIENFVKDVFNKPGEVLFSNL